MIRLSRLAGWLPCALFVPVAACTGAGGGGTSKADVTVHVLDADGAAAAGVSVLFSNADGSPREVIATDADGVASATVPRGGMATAALELSSLQKRLETVAGLEDGDEIWIQRDRGPTALTLEVTFTTVPGAQTYGAVAGCGYAAQSNTAMVLALDLPLECVTSAVGLFASGSNGAGHPIAYAIENPGATSGTIPLTPDPWRTDFEDVPLTITGVPADFGILSVSLGAFIDRRWLALPAWSETLTEMPGGAITMKRAPLLGIAQRAQAAASHAAGDVSVDTRDASLPGAVTLDLADSLPRIVSLGFAAREVDWTVESEPEADVFHVGVAGAWQLRLPPDTEPPFGLPELPAELAAWEPGGTTLTLTYEDADYFDGFDDVRNANAVDDLLPESWAVRRSSAYD